MARLARAEVFGSDEIAVVYVMIGPFVVAFYWVTIPSPAAIMITASSGLTIS